jgi:type III pantothenate kinase
MILAVDVGNTRIKAAVYEDNNIIEAFVFDNAALTENLELIIEKYPELQQMVAASVANADQDTFLAFADRMQVSYITHQSAFPFSNKYETPTTLGIDRMVLAAAAVLKFPATNRLIIDAGTCITYDFVDENDSYHGGAISPGLKMRYESMHNYTARLPLLNIQEHDGLIGGSTATSMHSGVVNGTAYEVDGFINQYKEMFPNIIIILTGGDGVFLAKRLKNTIFANSNFLLEGLVQTFQYKSQND